MLKLRNPISLIIAYSLIWCIIFATLPSTVRAEETEIEILDGKYTLSPMIQLTNSSVTGHDYYYYDIDDNVVLWDISGLGDPDIGMYFIDNGTTYNHTNGGSFGYPRVHDNRVSYRNTSGLDSIIEVLNLTDMSVLQIDNGTDRHARASIFEEIVTYQIDELAGNYTIYMYYISNNTAFIIEEDDSTAPGARKYYQPDIHNEYIAYYSVTLVPAGKNYLMHYYDYEEKIYNDWNFTDYTDLDLDFYIASNIRIWRDEIVFDLYYESGDLDDGWATDIMHYDISTDILTNLTTLDQAEHEVEYVDISRNIVVWGDLRSEDRVGIYGYDLEEGEEFLIDQNTSYDAYDPAVWMGEDGNGYVVYHKSNGGTDVAFRYINLTAEEEPEEELTISQLFTRIVISLIPLYVVMWFMTNLLGDENDLLPDTITKK